MVKVGLVDIHAEVAVHGGEHALGDGRGVPGFGAFGVERRRRVHLDAAARDRLKTFG